MFDIPFDALKIGETSAYKPLRFTPEKDAPILSFSIEEAKFIRYVNPQASDNYTYVIDSITISRRAVFSTPIREE